MAKAILVFQDDVDGKVNVKVTHVEGFDRSSNAHRLSIQVTKFLDEQCASKEAVEAEEATPEERAFAARVGAMEQPILVPR